MLNQDEYSYLVNLTKNYLIDAGFTEDLFNIVSYKDTGFIEVYFDNNDAVDYLMDDIIKTSYFNLICIKKFLNEDKTITAIVTLKDN